MKIQKMFSNRSLPRGLVVALLGVAFLGSCVTTEEAPVFYVTGSAAVTQQEQCVARPNPRSTRSRGLMDAYLTNRYYMFPLIQNYLEPTIDNDLYGEIHNIQLLGASLTYDYPENLDGATKSILGAEYFEIMGGSVLAGDPGVSGVNIVPPEVGNSLRNEPFTTTGGYEIVANVTVEGRLSDGTIVHSNTFYYPIAVCSGCLVMNLVADPTDLSSAQDMRAPCIIGQDDGVDARLLTAMGIPQPPP